MWSVGINITSSILLETPIVAGGYGYHNKNIGFIYFTPLVAVALGEFIGHFLNDFIANRYVKNHGGLFKPEARLYTSYLGGLLMIPGLIVVGQTLEKHLSVAGIILGWGMVSCFVIDGYTTLITCSTSWESSSRPLLLLHTSLTHTQPPLLRLLGSLTSLVLLAVSPWAIFRVLVSP